MGKYIAVKVSRSDIPVWPVDESRWPDGAGNAILLLRAICDGRERQTGKLKAVWCVFPFHRRSCRSTFESEGDVGRVGMGIAGSSFILGRPRIYVSSQSGRPMEKKRVERRGGGGEA